MRKNKSKSDIDNFLTLINYKQNGLKSFQTLTNTSPSKFQAC